MQIKINQDSKEWQDWRLSKVGASDANAIIKGQYIGCSLCKRAHYTGWDDLRRRQTGERRELCYEQQLNAEYGKIKEPKARQILNHAYDVSYKPDVFTYDKEFLDKDQNPQLVASLDGFNRKLNPIKPLWVEIKCPVSETSPYIKQTHHKDSKNPVWWQLVLQAAVLQANLDIDIRFHHVVLFVMHESQSILNFHKIRVNRLLRDWPKLKTELYRYFEGQNMGAGQELDLSFKIANYTNNFCEELESKLANKQENLSIPDVEAHIKLLKPIGVKKNG